MAIRNPQPPQIDGVTYDFLSVSLAMSTTPRDSRMALSIAVTFRPYRDGENGPEVLEAVEPTVLVYGDAMAAAQGDPALARFLGILEAAAQRFVDERV
jgi:hypothetical protein